MSYETGLSVEERVTSLFQPDTLLPAQYFETFRRKFQLEPEKRLLLAVLEDAIACFQKYLFAHDGKGKTLFRDTEDWILERDTDWLFSFGNICDVLGFNADYVRDGLMKWKEQRLAEHPKAKIYHLAPRRQKRKGGVSVSGRTGQKLLKAAGR